LIVTVKWINW